MLSKRLKHKRLCDTTCKLQGYLQSQSFNSINCANQEITFPLPHSRGSSHGQTRLIRKAYPEDFYTKMMEESYQLWAQLERESNTVLCRQTGLLVIGDEQKSEFQTILKTLGRNQCPHQYHTTEQFQKRFPGVLLQPGEAAFSDVSAGILYADKALKAVQDRFRQLGGIICDGERVTNITPGTEVTVNTASEVYRAKSLVITAGPWASKVLSPLGLRLPLQPLGINVCYWKEKVPGAYGIPQKFPCFVALEPNGAPHEVYGLPSNEYPGLMKVCYHYGNKADPDMRDCSLEAPPLQDIEILRNFVRKYLPGLEPEPAIMERCMYTNTPDDNFILDRHPKFQNIIVGAGFSGHGFKFSPVVGKILCELSMGKEPSHNLEPFRLARFSTS
ncbi:peroxisomal sarcosine oxidase isoform X2 [Pleurodeles waltl]|uniref:peroxisomal sarcosine oxidase isoform X2 n=1 Tax=Pleurodeles waltl TaxID=8319 RepID=UPI0037097688